MPTKFPCRVRIIGDHPWKGCAGTALSLEKPIYFCPPMIRVRLDAAADVPDDQECFADPENLRVLTDGC